MPALTFRIKLLLAMMGVVVGVAGATLSIAERRFQDTYQQLFTELFLAHNQAFSDQQRLLLDSIQETCVAVAGTVRVQAALRAALDGGEPELLYKRITDELATRQVPLATPEDNNPLHPRFYFIMDDKGQIIDPPARVLPGMKPLAEQDRLKAQLTAASPQIAQAQAPLVGYLTPSTTGGVPRLHQAVYIRILDTATGENLGALVLGFLVPRFGSGGGQLTAQGGIWFDGRLHADAVDPGKISRISEEAGRKLASLQGRLVDWTLAIGGEPHRAFAQLLPGSAGLARAHLVAWFPLGEAIAAQRALRNRVVGFGVIGIAAALAVSLILSHGLSVPIRDLVAATTEIQKGRFDVTVPIRSRDELGHLAESFNEMAKGLALKETYRSVLDKVTDKRVADELLSGSVALGGEERPVSVLFCDIRGFTALTQGMAPSEVVRMLNEHFTPLTAVVTAHHGIVDKFVGDLIMAVFGAPVSYGNDAENAARCALAMIQARRDLNASSKYKIEMGIGIASGPALAGCMGSADRLNYTVLGERVNLASRLCSKAGRMDVVIDKTTRDLLPPSSRVEPLPELELKGFTGRVPAFNLIETSPQ